MSKPVKVTTSNDNVYLVSMVNVEDEMWGAFAPGEDEPTFIFAAPSDATKDTLSGEVDFMELTNEDDVPVGFDDFDRESSYSY